MKNDPNQESNQHVGSISVTRLQMRLVLLIVAGALLHSAYSDAFVHPDGSASRRRCQMGMQAISTAPKGREENNTESDNVPGRSKWLNRIGFKRLSQDAAEIRNAQSRDVKQQEKKYNVQSLQELDSYFADEQKLFRDEKGEIDYSSLLKSLSVKGDTQIIGSPDHPNYVHPVLKLLHQRKRSNSKCTEGTREDGFKIALAVEGGGMRGCVSAGMVCAIHHLGLRDTIDVVYGSSAGSIIGAYFINEQLPWFGPEVYYDKLTTAGKEFIDTGRLLRSLGFGLVDPRLFRDVLTRPNNGKPVLNLSFLLKETMQRTKPLDWKEFAARQATQPLVVVASGLKSTKPVLMDMANGDFESLHELSECMHASCLLPGIAGPVMNKKMNKQDTERPKFLCRNHFTDPDYEPLGDALLSAPIPYDVAINDGATHVLVLRTRPDGTDVSGKSSMFERLIFRRFFLRKNKLPVVFEALSKQLHKKLYSKNVIELNEAAFSERDYEDTSQPHVMAVALPPGSAEVTRLETGREAIFEGVRRGFARAYDALVEDPAERGRGHIVARQYFPDEILDYDPRDFGPGDEAAFESYMKQSGTKPKLWGGSEFSF